LECYRAGARVTLIHRGSSGSAGNTDSSWGGPERQDQVLDSP
jgi:hypothetical protein